jgi:hypothetical protein
VAKDRIEGDDLASKLMETAASADDPGRPATTHRQGWHSRIAAWKSADCYDYD